MTSAFSDHLQQSLAGMLVISVSLQVVSELVDTSREEGHLNLGASCIFLVKTELLEHLFLLVVFHSESELKRQVAV